MASPRRKGAEVLLVEPWFAGSHRAWAEGLQTHSRHHISLLTREPAGWRSTIEDSARKLADNVGAAPELIVASSMMDVAEFVALARFEDVPLLLYLHENQLTYDREKPDIGRGSVNWRSVEAADRIAFNSSFHRDDFLAAVPMLGVSGPAIGTARRKSTVLPVGIDPALVNAANAADGGPPVVLWNHRWEADKDPDAFLGALMACTDLSFRLVLAGEARGADSRMTQLTDRFGDRVLHAGFAPADLYPVLLSRSDLVVSTAHQEFFGVAVAEAMASGAVPLVPDRLAYPELLGPDLAGCRYPPGTFPTRLRSALTDLNRLTTLKPAARAAGGRFDWRRIAPRYDELIDAMI